MKSEMVQVSPRRKKRFERAEAKKVGTEGKGRATKKYKKKSKTNCRLKGKHGEQPNGSDRGG